jgi:hypothetical protein
MPRTAAEKGALAFMKAISYLFAIILGFQILKAQDSSSPTVGSDTQIVGSISAIDTNTGVIVLSENSTTTLKVMPRKISSIVLWTLQIGQIVKVTGSVDQAATPPSMTITSLDNISQLNADGSVIAWANPITVEGDPEIGRPPMLAFTAPIRQSDAKKAHDDLFQRYQDKLDAQSARITTSLGGHTGLPLDLNYYMTKDAVLQQLKLIDQFRVDSKDANQLAYVVPNPDSNTKNALFVTFDNDKLVRIADMKSGMSKPMFDSYMQQLKGIASQWKAKGAATVFEKETDMYYVYKDVRSYMSISGTLLGNKSGLYSVTVEFTEQNFQNRLLNKQ